MIPTNVDVYRSIHVNQSLINYSIQYDSQVVTLISRRCNNLVFFYQAERQGPVDSGSFDLCS
jgi:hypothetical protein